MLSKVTLFVINICILYSYYRSDDHDDCFHSDYAVKTILTAGRKLKYSIDANKDCACLPS